MVVGLHFPLGDHDEYDGDEELHQAPRHHHYFRIALLLALFSMVGFTVAANVGINGNNKIEFGQGIYRITSCDQFVAVDLGSSEVFQDGLSRVLNVKLSGFDVARCANTSIRIKLYDATNSAPMNLFTNPTYTKSGVTYPCCTETGTAVTMVIAANATQATALQSTTLVSPSGKNIAQGDRSESISYDSASGIFTIAFASPLAIMRDVARTTLESAPNV